MKFFQVSSFTEDVFCGNPAGVCLLEEKNSWPQGGTMQSIAAQLNLSETVFVLEKNGEFYLRWFTPTVEVDLCGHGTLAAAHVLFNEKNRPLGGGGGQCFPTMQTREPDSIVFKSRLHTLPVYMENGKIVLDFPMADIKRIDVDAVPRCFNFIPREVWTGRDEYMLVYNSEDEIRNIDCDIEMAKKIVLSGFIVTAKSSREGIDFVSRYFGPKIGINEDPVTGSAHTLLVPYWQRLLGKSEFRAKQLSSRGGDLFCTAWGDRVKIAGNAVTFLRGKIVL